MIEVIAVGFVEKDILFNIYKELREIFYCSFNPSNYLPIPDKVYDKRRGQYKSDLLLSMLSDYSKRSKADIVLGITGEDIFTRKQNFVFGQAYIRGDSCIISLKRLDPKFYGIRRNDKLLIKRSVKEAVHEIGHCLGLDHCSDAKCVMVFSNIVDGVDTKGVGFCEDCMNKLQGIFDLARS
jgi:archaemetzincin